MKGPLVELADRKTLRVAGLMSGTSADGVSVAIADINARGARLRAFATIPHPRGLRARIFRLFQPATSRVDEICRMNFVLGEVFAAALIRTARKARIPLGSIHLIGSHGQTIHHLPPRKGGSGATLQIGEPSVIAERTGITTVADFRPRDMAAGGQGAPLVPFADLFLFGAGKRSRVLLNIGGIANITWLPAGGRASGIIAFDTGPGNMIIDRLAWHASAGRRDYDRDGKLAAQGTVDGRLLAGLMRHAFLKRRPPKSTGREEFGVQFADRLWLRARKARMRPADLLATATAFTALSIAGACTRFLPGPVDELVLCGGGAHNPTLVAMLRGALPAGVRITAPEKYGVTADFREALAFAVLAWATVKGMAGNVPSATGARWPVVLGKIVPGSGTGRSKCRFPDPGGKWVGAFS
ncbi:MAG: anhydro-N-acetylmuramic acid kinase [Planctomycetota bacterium]